MKMGVFRVPNMPMGQSEKLFRPMDHSVWWSSLTLQLHFTEG